MKTSIKTLCLSVALLVLGPVNAQKRNTLVLDSEMQMPIVGKNHPDVISSNNKSGFETGQAVKIGDTYHIFVNEMFGRSHRDMRISYWTTKNGSDWKRHSTIVNSIPGRSATNPRSEVWVTGVVFNKKENAWNIFYVAYRGGDESKGEIAGFDYEGRIWRAKSVVSGKKGIAGPYEDVEIVLQPDANSQAWEGQQAVASFNPYQVKNKWYSVYDGHTHIPRGGWPSGLATADNLSGPWTRMPDSFNPLKIVDNFMENAVVTKLKDGSYVMVYDSLGNQEIGYSFSNDGVNWSKELRVKVQEKYVWAEDGDHYMRTPLCIIEEKKGLFTVFYTAKLKKENFYALGMCQLKMKKK